MSCYNEILINATKWQTSVPSANPAYFPGIVWAFVYVKGGGDLKTPPGVWKAFTTQAWHNFNSIYSNDTSLPPLLEIDVLADKTTPPFSVVCQSKNDASEACKAALLHAGISGSNELYCPNKMEGKITGNKSDGFWAECV